jgi:hypothetical protein
LCDPSQDSQFQADRFPRLKAGPGSQIIAHYLENGYISAPVSSASVVGDICWFGTGGGAVEAGYRAKSSCIAYPALCRWWIGVRTTECTLKSSLKMLKYIPFSTNYNLVTF